MGQFITPDVLPEDTFCRVLLIPNDPKWIGAVTGALLPMIYESEWVQFEGITPEEAADRARVMFYEYLDSNGCVDMANNCCEDVPRRYRVNPETGVFQQSNNGGSTWGAMSGGFESIITEPMPPVTSGVAGTMCDAASNVREQVSQWVTQVSNNFDTATSLLEFGAALILAIAGAVLVYVTGGAFLPAETVIIGALGAALAAAWSAGKAVFDAYWTTDKFDIVLCAAFCNISSDGSFSDAQFSAFWNECNSNLPPSPAKMLFMGFLSSVGKAGLNAMAASGVSADSDCEDCDCGTCSPSLFWAKLNFEGSWFDRGTVIETGEDYVIVETVDRGDGQQIVSFAAENLTQCCNIRWENYGETPAHMLHFYTLCGTEATYENLVQNDLMPNDNNVTSYFFQCDAGSWQFKFTFLP